MKSAIVVIPLSILLGCGPSAPAESPKPATTTSTATSEPASTSSSAVSDPSAASSTAPSAAPAAPAAPSAAPSAAPDAKPAAPPATPPTVTGTLGGKPFTPKAAITMGPLFNGRVLIALADYDAACGKGVELTEGMRTLALMVEWKPGSVAFSKDPKKPKGWTADPWFTVAATPPKQMQQTKLPSKGTVELASAPKQVGEVTRLKLDITSGKDNVKGEIDLAVCWEIQEPPAK